MFQIPDNVRFDQAIALTQALLKANPDDDILEATIGALLQTANGARGFFVDFLTGESPLADHPTEAILRSLRAHPDPAAELMVKNLAMSTAMEITHRRSENHEQARGSARVYHRTARLIQHVGSTALKTQLQHLKASLDTQTGDYQAFLERWGYDEEQRREIDRAVTAVLGQFPQ